MKILRFYLLISVLSASICAAQDVLPWTVVSAFPLSSAPSEQGGPGARIAINPETGRPVVVFLKGGTEPGNVLVIMWDYPAGTQDGWFKTELDLGVPISDLDMDFWISQTLWKVGVSFRDRSTEALKFLEFHYDRVGGSYGVGTSIIKDEASFKYGVGTTVRYGSSGNAHVATHVRPVSMGLESLMYATYVGSSGNCGSGAWACQTVDAGDEVGRDPSLTLDAAEEPVIAYTKLYGDLDIVFVAQTTSTGTGNCGGGLWSCAYPDYVTGYYNQGRASVHFDRSPAQSGIHVAFFLNDAYGSSPISIRHAALVGVGDGNCGVANDWECDHVPLNAEGDSMELGTNAAGNPVLAFRSSALDEVAFVEYLGVAWSGNCGNTEKWQCGALEPDLGLSEMGEWLDLAVDESGRPQVVYSKYLTGPFYTYELELAYPWVFADGFESSDVAAWSSSVP